MKENKINENNKIYNIRTLDSVLLDDLNLIILKKLINSSYDKYMPKKQK